MDLSFREIYPGNIEVPQKIIW